MKSKIITKLEQFEIVGNNRNFVSQFPADAGIITLQNDP